MSDQEFRPQDACHCCEGVSNQAPIVIHNRAGLSAIAYRIGDHADFLATMLARLSSKDYPALARLRTRDSDDFSIALLDAYASMADVLSFYQERIANESYLRSANERLSLQEQARLIGYRLNPGVAAETYLAFTVEDAEGAPEQVRLDSGIKTQSVPGQDEKPQTFETLEKIDARPQWNAIAAQTSTPWIPTFGDKELYLAGTNHQLKAGDVILIVGKHRRDNPGSERWDARLLESVEIDAANDRTRVTWHRGLGHTAPYTDPAEANVDVFVFRQQAALFGHNAPDPHMLSTSGNGIGDLIDTSTYTWNDFEIQDDQIDLDAAYNKIVPDNWLLLVSNENFNDDALPGYVELYRANTVSIRSRSGFGISSKITRIEPDTNENLTHFALRDTLVYGQSEQLPTIARPLNYPLYGDELALDQIVEGLTPGKAVAVSGKRARIGIDADGLSLQLDSGGSRTLTRSDSLLLAAAPQKLAGATTLPLTPAEFGEALTEEPAPTLHLVLLDRDGMQGTLDASADKIQLLSAEENDITVAEIVSIADLPTAVNDDRDRTTLDLAGELAYIYDRATVQINANVVRASHGETVHQILGNGEARQAHQRFNLKHAPLTYIRANNESGGEAALEVRVNDIAWHEVATHYDTKPADRHYVVRVDEDGVSTIQFGDGIRGARLPTGQENVRAVYRKGIGIAGNLKPKQLSQLLSRPLGLKAVTNPTGASGGVDAESADDARRNMPLGVRTLGRAVSLQDYEDYARAYTGIAKAQAIVLPIRGIRTIFISVAGKDGVRPEAGGPTLSGLLDSLKSNSDPFVACDAASYNLAYFKLALSVKRHPDHDIEIVLADVETALREAFSFNQRDFGQIVARSEVINVAQQVSGVMGVDVDYFYRGATPSLEERLAPATATVDSNDDGVAAELLLLDPGPFDKLEEML
jgi:hypothetical protein